MSRHLARVLTVEHAKAISKLTLYKRVLYAAKTYPSKRRPEIINEIKLSFREGRTETDPEKLRQRVEHALNAIRLMEQYKSATPDNPNWVISLD